MQYVKDSTGDEWFIDLNLGTAETLDAFTREAYGVEVFDAVGFMTLLSRPFNVVSIASNLCSDQRKERGLEPADFGRRWKGESAYKLQMALMEEYRFFYPNIETAALIDSMMGQLRRLNELERTAVKKAMEELTETMTQAVDELVNELTTDKG